MPDIQLNIKVDKSGAVKNIDELRKELEKIQGGDSVQVKVETDEAEKKVKSLGELLQQAVSLEAVGMLSEKMAAVAERTSETVDAFKILKAQTGAIGADFEFLKNTAADLYADGVGDSYADAAKAIATAKRTLGEFVADGDKGLVDFTRIAGGIAKVFDKDINEVISGSRTFIANFKLEGKEAGELVAYAMQNASGKMDDVLDTMDEYSQLAVTAGYSAQQFTDIIVRGMQAGARDTDKLADAIKETQIRLNAGDTAKALADINAPVARSIESIVKLGAAGVLTVQEVLQQSSREIAKAVEAGDITNALRDQLNTAISGTMAEDLGGQLYTKIFSADFDTAELEKKAAEAAKLMAEAIEPKGVFENLQKTASVALDNVAASFSPVISAADGALKAASGVAPALILVGQAAPAIKTASLAIMGVEKAAKLAAVAQRALSLAMAAAPWVLAIAGVAALVYAVSQMDETYGEHLQSMKAANDAELEMVQTQKKLNQTKQDEEISTLQLIKNYEKLASKTNRTAEENRQLASVTEELNGKYPGVIDKTKTFDEVLLALSEKAGLSKNKLAELRGEFAALTEQEFNIKIADIDIQQSIISNNIYELFNELGQEANGYTNKLFKALDEKAKSAVNDSELNKAYSEALSKLQVLYERFGLSGDAYNKAKTYIAEYIKLEGQAIQQENSFEEQLAKGSAKMQEYANKIDKIAGGMSQLSKADYTSALKKIKSEFNSLPEAAFNEGEVSKLNKMVEKTIAAWKQSATNKAAIDKEAQKKAEDARNAYEKFIEDSLSREEGLYRDHYDRTNKDSIDALNERKNFLDSSNRLAIDKVKELIDIEGKLRDLTVDEIGVTLSIQDDPAQMNKQIADRLKADIAAVRERETEALKLQKVGSDAYTLIRIQASKEIEALEKDAIDRNGALRQKTERDTQEAILKLRSYYADIEAQQTIDNIHDVNEQEYAIAVTAAKKNFEARIKEVRGAYALEYDAFRQYQEDKIAAEQAYLEKTQGIFATFSKDMAGSLQDAISEGLQFPDAGDNKAKLDEAVQAIEQQGDALKTQYRNQEISRSEFYKRMNELDQQRIDAQKEFKETEIDYWGAVNTQIAKVYDFQAEKAKATALGQGKAANDYFAVYQSGLREKHDLEVALNTASANYDVVKQQQLLGDLIELENNNKRTFGEMERVATQALQSVAVASAYAFGSMVAQGVDAKTALLASAIDLVEGSIAALSPLIVAYAAASPLGPVLGPVIAGSVIAFITGMLEAAKADIMKHAEHGGLITGQEQAIIVNEKGPEYVVKASTTAKNLKALDYINKHDITVEEYVARHSGFKGLMFTPRKEDMRPINVNIDMKPVEQRLERIEKKLGKYRIENENKIGIKMDINERRFFDKIEINNAKSLVGI